DLRRARALRARRARGGLAPPRARRRGLGLDGAELGDQALDRGRRVPARGLRDVAALGVRDLREQAPGRDRVGPGFRDVLVRRGRVAVLDEQPGALVARAAAAARGVYQHPRAAELLAVQRKLELALGDGALDVGLVGLPGAAIPDHHRPAAVLVLRD